ncbi:MAG: hypothetical protein F6K53_38270 [Moorea sp. SIO4A1]|uniref:hypothetical protein n=1 Tax=Moorena sp. SIO4A1 TaxID=2607835 RepID=UPI00144B8924|nr:hypothetical protein [Moorena sp. SIO4A1]NEQ62898.1 hypothetical protein [Moorena sp. SIO4A1]
MLAIVKRVLSREQNYVLTLSWTAIGTGSVLMQSASGGNHGKARVGETTAKREWGEPRQSLMGETPKTALPPQDRAASPRPRCIAGHGNANSISCIWMYLVRSQMSLRSLFYVY